jgi:hypothetical protein
MDIYKIYYLSIHHLLSLLPMTRAKFAAKLLLLAKRVWKIKLAFSPTCQMPLRVFLELVLQWIFFLWLPLTPSLSPHAILFLSSLS